ncbi:gp45 [Listeria phage P40]|uniref:gp45 n=1 Tax=Listeria phage P40 TaxID=560178 RepID=UPI00018198FA|nr:gp45 [Listeria phage P40]ACI00405.1 gp45 [Listeria phage P40]
MRLNKEYFVEIEYSISGKTLWQTACSYDSFEKAIEEMETLTEEGYRTRIVEAFILY